MNVIDTLKQFQFLDAKSESEFSAAIQAVPKLVEAAKEVREEISRLREDFIPSDTLSRLDEAIALATGETR